MDPCRVVIDDHKAGLIRPRKGGLVRKTNDLFRYCGTSDVVGVIDLEKPSSDLPLYAGDIAHRVDRGCDVIA